MTDLKYKLASLFKTGIEDSDIEKLKQLLRDTGITDPKVTEVVDALKPADTARNNMSPSEEKSDSTDKIPDADNGAVKHISYEFGEEDPAMYPDVVKIGLEKDANQEAEQELEHLFSELNEVSNYLNNMLLGFGFGVGDRSSGDYYFDWQMYTDNGTLWVSNLLMPKEIEDNPLAIPGEFSIAYALETDENAPLDTQHISMSMDAVIANPQKLTDLATEAIKNITKLA